MKLARLACLPFLALSLVPLGAQDVKYSIKVGDAAPPKELNESIQKLLGKQSIELYDPAGKKIGEFWFRTEIPADATPEQIKNGLTYREVRQTEILAAVRFEQDARDYRKQKIKAGVYTLRLAYQPMDGDHSGSSQFQEFLVAVSAAKDKKADLLDVKDLVELSQTSINTGHPAVLMLFPNSKPGAKAELASKPKSHWVLNTKGEVVVSGKSAGTSLGIGLTVVGSAD